MQRTRMFLLVTLLLTVVLIFSACGKITYNDVNNVNTKVSESEEDKRIGIFDKTGEYYKFADDLGFEVVLKEKPKKVVSLIGSYAETWLLAGGELVGVTSDAYSEREMDLSENISVIGTVKEPNLEEILALLPDFVLLSADIESHKKLSQTLKSLNISHAFFKVEHFDDYLHMLKICTEITGKSELYELNGLAIKGKIVNILDNISIDKKPTVLFIRAFSTGAKAKTDDNMTGKMLKELGCDNIAARHKSLLDSLSIEEIISEDPDFIFVVTMGSSSEKALESLKSGIEKNPVWNKLSAVKNNRYIVLPKGLFHYKPTAKWGDAYEYLQKILYQ